MPSVLAGMPLRYRHGRSTSAQAANQAPPLVDHNTVTSDLALVEAVTRHASGEVLSDIAPIGAVASSAEAREHGLLANQHEPELVPYDRYGNRVDEVRFHPSWHWLMERGVGFGLQAAPWTTRRPAPARAPRRRRSSRGPRPSRATAARSR